jgi:hypothetical protein
LFPRTPTLSSLPRKLLSALVQKVTMLKQARAAAKSWVMISTTEKEGFVKLRDERILYISPSRTSLALTSPNTYPGTQPFSLKCDSGIAYITNLRVSPARLRTRARINHHTLDSLPSHNPKSKIPILLLTASQPARQLRPRAFLRRKLLDRNTSPRRGRRDPTRKSCPRDPPYVPRRRGL